MKSARRRSREFALQGLYSWLVGGQEVSLIVAQLQENRGYERADAAYLAQLLRGVTERQTELEAAIEPLLDRKLKELSPVERAILLLGAWELTQAPEIPFRVVINEGVELAKSYGGTDGHKYVNGVLDRLAKALRAHEAKAPA